MKEELREKQLREKLLVEWAERNCPLVLHGSGFAECLNCPDPVCLKFLKEEESREDSSRGK